jgi:hypothetical protein
MSSVVNSSGLRLLTQGTKGAVRDQPGGGGVLYQQRYTYLMYASYQGLGLDAKTSQHAATGMYLMSVSYIEGTSSTLAP